MRHGILFCLLAALNCAPSRAGTELHWSFQPVQRPNVPHCETGNPIDAFVRARLTEEKLAPSAPADRVTLIRRLYLIALGVPPTPDEVTRFVQDQTPGAFYQLVERALNDPRYGERWARHWLDVVRFAESNGFETNRDRPNAWRYRDYVIDAFNADKPYDVFIREQIAGDALGSEVATGFLVGGPVDIVGSPDPVLTAQQRADELDDIVSTTSTSFLGLTLGCARCHSHKFDPISHEEYYSMTALISGVKHGERPLPMAAEQRARLAELDSIIARLEKHLEPYRSKPVAGAGKLRPAVNAQKNEETFAPVEASRVRFTILASNSGEPCIDELEVYAGTTNVALAASGATAAASGTLTGFDIHQLKHVNDGKHGNSHSWIASQREDAWVQIEFAAPARIERIVWSRDREGMFKDRLATRYRIDVALESDVWKRVSSSEDREPFAEEEAKAPEFVFEGLEGAEEVRAKAWLAQLEDARKERAQVARPPMAYAGTFTDPPPVHRLHRGDPMAKREVVSPGTLKLFDPLTLETNAPENERRLRLAEWIASKENPLTARVLVNRVWQYHFGVGLVDTPNDFGKAGSRPTHPELLDWLASDLMDQGWSIKALQRRILTSAVWQQSSAPRPEAMEVDAGNRLLWRFSPRRLEAEAIRDSILAVSGNLALTGGGPGYYLHDVDRENVHHYFPKAEFGPAEHRRMIYAVKIRMEQDGIFGAFDCPDGSLVMPKRSASTTPLQALNLFNSRFVLDQSEIFARRLRARSGEDIQKQVEEAWELAFNRPPDAREKSEAAAFVRAEGLPALARAVLNANEFLFIP